MEKGFKNKIIGVKVIKKEEDLAPILREGIDAIPTGKQFNLSDEVLGNGETWHKEDIKEFIRLDRENLSLFINKTITWLEYLKRRRKLAGGKLI